MPDETIRPWPANSGDQSGGYWYQRGRFSFWASWTTWTIGVELPVRGEPSRYLAIHLGPLWIAWETTRDA